jgi:hypothetical protein
VEQTKSGRERVVQLSRRLRTALAALRRSGFDPCDDALVLEASIQATSESANGGGSSSKRAWATGVRKISAIHTPRSSSRLVYRSRM